MTKRRLKNLERLPSTVTKQEIDSRISTILAIDVHRVSLVTSAFLRLAVVRLVEKGELDLLDFGKFHRHGGRIDFRRSERLRRFLEEIAVEKLGVDEGIDQEKMEKAASEGCPECGAPVEKHGNVLACPVHGTEPFERK